MINTPAAETQMTGGAIPELIASKPADRSRWVSAYTAAVSALGLILTALAIANLPADWPGLALFMLMAAVAELFSVELFSSSRNATVSMSGIIAIASILVFGPLAGALTHLAPGLLTALTTTVIHPQSNAGKASPLRRSIFNMSMWVAAAALAGWTYAGLGGAPGSVRQLSNLLPLAGATTVDVVVNIALLIGVVALQTGRHPMRIWRQDFRWTVPITAAGSILGGGALALAYDTLGLLGVAVFLLPILSTSYAFRLYVRHTKGYVNQLEEMNRSLEQANLGLLETLGAVLDADDVYTYGHSKQVAIYAGALAEQLGLSSRDQALVTRAALVHDIGKVGIRDSIIGKQGSLTDEEYAALKRHPEIGAEIVGRMSGLSDLVLPVRHHHERWDGRGYPDGLAGEDIPLAARIVGLADALEAMCSDRPYRPTRSLAEVVQEVSRCAGAQFDPRVVDAFLALVKVKGPGFFKNSAAAVDDALQLAGAGDGRARARYLKRSMVGARK